VNFKRHLIGASAAVVWFLVMSLLSQSWGPATMFGVLGILLSCTGAFFHYRRRGRTVARADPASPNHAARDDRVIPQEVKIAVAVRDGGMCQIQGPPCTGTGEVYDHIFPWARGGSSKDPDNIQMACRACNSWKSDKLPGEMLV
jgi:hypothetical protein